MRAAIRPPRNKKEREVVALAQAGIARGGIFSRMDIAKLAERAK